MPEAYKKNIQLQTLPPRPLINNKTAEHHPITDITAYIAARITSLHSSFLDRRFGMGTKWVLVLSIAKIQRSSLCGINMKAKVPSMQIP